MAATAHGSLEVGGRRIDVRSSGDPGGTPLLLHTGTPSPPVRWDSLDATAAARGIRVVSYARPGYSGSTRRPGRSVSDAAADTVAVADHVGVRTFVALGHSGGGPHALACGALTPDRCLAVATLGGAAPYVEFGEGWVSGMAEENVEEFGLAMQGEHVLRPRLAEELEAYADVSGAEIAGALGGLVTDVDRAALAGELLDMLARSLRRAARDGLDGWVDDDLAFVAAWGFAPDSIEVPVAVWHGRHDRMVPFSHEQWLHARIPTSRPRLLDDEGHLSLLTRRLGDILDDLLGLAEATGRA